MRQWYRIFNVAFVVALGVSFVQCGKSSQSADGEAGSAEENGHSSVVYINTDSLLLKYEYAKVLNDVIMQKEESSRTDFNQKYRVFQQDAMEFNVRFKITDSFLWIVPSRKSNAWQKLSAICKSLTTVFPPN